jgi:4'-phosphopantetheinyl transferase
MTETNEPVATVQVWHGETDVIQRFPLYQISLLALLSDDEVSRYNRYFFARNRDEHLLAHAMKRWVLSRTLDVEPCQLTFGSDKYGRPYVQYPHCREIDFNLSHSDGVAVMAVSSHALVGIDIESTNRGASISALASTFSRDEVNVLANTPAEQKYKHAISIWSAREALSKAIGVGLRLDSEAISVTIDAAGSIRLHHISSVYGKLSDWHLMQKWMSYRHVLTCAARRPDQLSVAWHIRSFHEAGPLTNSD